MGSMCFGSWGGVDRFGFCIGLVMVVRFIRRSR